jgi:hypothetical protein
MRMMTWISQGSVCSHDGLLLGIVHPAPRGCRLSVRMVAAAALGACEAEPVRQARSHRKPHRAHPPRPLLQKVCHNQDVARVYRREWPNPARVPSCVEFGWMRLSSTARSVLFGLGCAAVAAAGYILLKRSECSLFGDASQFIFLTLFRPRKTVLRNRWQHGTQKQLWRSVSAPSPS